MLMDPFVRYYLYHSCRGKHNGIGPIYAATPFFSVATVSAVIWQGYGEWLDRFS